MGPLSFANLYEPGPVGSQFAENNEAEILARMIPAGTNATGREAVGAFGLDGLGQRNTNMQAFQDHGWPVERNQDDPANPWLHSDFYDVAYPYVQALFEGIVDKGENI